MSASDATLSTGLGLLTSDWQWVADGLLSGQYSLWIGSAVSKDCFPDLWQLLRRLLSTLHEHRDNKRYERCLREILDIAGEGRRDLSRSPAEWDDLDSAILPLLVRSYSRVLGITIDGEAEDVIAWDLLKVQEVYDDPEVEPDADHRLIALLIAEGVVRKVVTTNWDPLIEDAFAACHGDSAGSGLTVVAGGSQVHDTQPPVIYKIHGCARHMRRQPDLHRRWLVATESQIRGWYDDDEWQAFRDQVEVLIRNSRSLFIGLSAQDENLQVIYRRAVTPFVEESAFERQRVVFAKPELEYEQKEILKALYRGHDGGYTRDVRAIDRKTALPLFSKPLLGSLYVRCLLEKLRTLYDSGPADEHTPDRDRMVDEGLAAFRQLLIDRYDGIADPTQRWRRLVQELPRAVSRFVRLFYSEELAAETSWEYRVLNRGDLRQLKSDENLRYSGLHRLVLILAALQSGNRDGRWRLRPARGWDASCGQLVLGCGKMELKIHVLLQPVKGLPWLIQQGSIDMDRPEEHLILYVRGRGGGRGRSAAVGSALPGARAPEPIEIWIEEHLDGGSRQSFLESLETEIPCSQPP